MDYSKINTLKLDNTKKLRKILSANIETPGKITRFQSAIDQLGSNQKKLEQLYSSLGKDISEIEKAKNDLRNELLKKIWPVITILQIFAYDKKKKNLKERLESLTGEYLQNCTDMELISVSKKIWLSANKFGGYSLAFIHKIKSTLNADKSKKVIKLEKEYGLIPDMIRTLEEANIKFIESLLLFEDEVKEKDKTVKKIKKLNAQTDLLLQNKIDLFVRLLENDKPELYKEYSHARKNLLLKDINDIMETEIETITTTSGPVDQIEGDQANHVEEGSNQEEVLHNKPRSAKKAGV
jgi:hypothetical protein